MTDETHARIASDFHGAVNMAPAELERWLRTDESKSVGWAGGKPKSGPGGEPSIGHRSGERIVRIMRVRPAELEEDDYAHMRKVVGYVRRHTAQRPRGDVSHTRWRYSLMNWGHDPLKT